MSDTYTPTHAPAAAPAPAANEVPIDTSPVSSPQPIGSQAPDKSPADHRREALERAFQRSEHPPAKDAKAPARRATPPPAEAKAGHNQPPEETEKLDLKRRPSEQPRERGRFAPRQPDANSNAPLSQASQQTQPAQPAQHAWKTAFPEGTPYREPPPRMAEHAKADWHAVPATVRGEIGRMHQEFGAAHQYYRADHEQMNAIRPFQQMAAQHRTTLQQALGNYVSIEQKLRADPIAGLDNIVNNLGLVDPQTGQPITLRDVAYYILNQSPDQHKLLAAQQTQTAQSHQMGQLYQAVIGLAQNQQRAHLAEQYRGIMGGIDRYAETHPRVDELADLITAEVRQGYDLDTAYRRADLLRPPRAAQTRNPSAQTRQPTDKSIYGAPSASSANGGAHRRSDKPVGRRDAIQRAINASNGSL